MNNLIFSAFVAFCFFATIHGSLNKFCSKLKPRNGLARYIAITTAGAFSILQSSVLPANALSFSEQSAIDNIIRVQLSLKYIDDDINNGSKDADQVVSAVKTLIKNYNFKENVAKTIQLLPNGKKNEGKEHGQAAIEDLANIYECVQFYYLALL